MTLKKKRKVSFEQGVALAKKWNASFVEMSSMYNINVSAAFEDCARLASQNLSRYSSHKHKSSSKIKTKTYKERKFKK